jgi:hypothetical protein
MEFEKRRVVEINLKGEINLILNKKNSSQEPGIETLQYLVKKLTERQQ